jgi:hypothetical protein
MKKNLLAFLFICIFTACEEDVVSGLNPPKLEARGIRADRFSFAITVEEDGVHGKFYFMVQESNEASPTAQQLRSSQFATVVDLNGANFKTASMPGLKSKTQYTLYAMIESDEQLSSVVSLDITTL